MKSIHTLIPDIQDVVKNKEGALDDAWSQALGTSIAKTLRSHFSDDRSRGSLRLSRMGPQCPKALWYSVHHPELAEPLPPSAIIKYSYGHVLEAMVLALAKAAGHTVEGEQDELVVDGIVGHRDAVIDGYLVDVKSASSQSFTKFKDKTISQSDLFGYLDQLDGYLVGCADDPLVTVKDTAYLLAIDKQLGHMCLYQHKLREEHIRERIRDYKEIAALPEAPECRCGTVADGKSGNRKLDTRASYNSYKYCCNPKLRTFIYASGPVYLTEVGRKPDVMEVDKHGNIVYN